MKYSFHLMGMMKRGLLLPERTVEGRTIGHYSQRESGVMNHRGSAEERRNGKQRIVYTPIMSEVLAPFGTPPELLHQAASQQFIHPLDTITELQNQIAEQVL